MVGLEKAMKTPYAMLIPWAAVAGVVIAAWAGIHQLVLEPEQQHLRQLEATWATARQQLAQRVGARQTVKDLAHLIALLPTTQDFDRFPLAITEEAKRNHVILRQLSYVFEETDHAPAVKATFQGPITGRYGDLRRFIAQIEASDRLLFIEDLDVGHHTGDEKEAKNKEMMTFKMKISTYVRPSSNEPAVQEQNKTMKKASANQMLLGSGDS